MIILQDAREKRGQHNSIEEYCKSNDIPLFRVMLDVGDYMFGSFENGKFKPIGERSVDCKKDLSELASDLYRDKLSFNKKYRKCFDSGIKLYVLIEQDIKSLRDIINWSSPHTKINGRMLLDMIDRLRVSYGIKFMFCNPCDTGKTIISILKGEK